MVTVHRAVAALKAGERRRARQRQQHAGQKRRDQGLHRRTQTRDRLAGIAGQPAVSRCGPRTMAWSTGEREGADPLRVLAHSSRFDGEEDEAVRCEQPVSMPRIRSRLLRTCARPTPSCTFGPSPPVRPAPIMGRVERGLVSVLIRSLLRTSTGRVRAGRTFGARAKSAAAAPRAAGVIDTQVCAKSEDCFIEAAPAAVTPRALAPRARADVWTSRPSTRPPAPPRRRTRDRGRCGCTAAALDWPRPWPGRS